MKKTIQLFAVLVVLSFPVLLSAQPQPWDPSVGGGEGKYPVGGGAPIGGGLVLLMTLAAGYAGKKIYDFRRQVMD